MLGGLQVAAPTVATAHRAQATAGILIAALSVGGIVGAALYGLPCWRAEPSRRLLALLTLMTLALLPMIAVLPLWVVGALLVAAGLPLNPALTTCSLLVDQHVVRRSAGEAFGWLSTAIAGGTGAGSAIAAAVVQHQDDAQSAFIVAAVAAAAAAGVAIGARHLLASRTGR
jgi:predicted MFS family arabinose efflux permease